MDAPDEMRSTLQGLGSRFLTHSTCGHVIYREGFRKANEKSESYIACLTIHYSDVHNCMVSGATSNADDCFGNSRCVTGPEAFWTLNMHLGQGYDIVLPEQVT